MCTYITQTYFSYDVRKQWINAGIWQNFTSAVISVQVWLDKNKFINKYINKRLPQPVLTYFVFLILSFLCSVTNVMICSKWKIVTERWQEAKKVKLEWCHNATVKKKFWSLRSLSADLFLCLFVFKENTRIKMCLSWNLRQWSEQRQRQISRWQNKRS